MDFPVTINSQEDFDHMIGDRLKRERETAAKKYADYDELKSAKAALEKQIGEIQSQIESTSIKSTEFENKVAELTGKVKEYEGASLKARIAHEMGIPYELAGRLSGEDEQAIRKDAEVLAKHVAHSTPTPPLKSNEPAGDGKNAGYKALLSNLKGDE